MEICSETVKAISNTGGTLSPLLLKYKLLLHIFFDSIVGGALIAAPSFNQQYARRKYWREQILGLYLIWCLLLLEGLLSRFSNSERGSDKIVSWYGHPLASGHE